MLCDRSVATSSWRITGLSLSTCRYDAQRPSADAHISVRITELALERRRFGYRRIWGDSLDIENYYALRLFFDVSTLAGLNRRNLPEPGMRLLFQI